MAKLIMNREGLQFYVSILWQRATQARIGTCRCRKPEPRLSSAQSPKAVPEVDELLCKKPSMPLDDPLIFKGNKSSTYRGPTPRYRRKHCQIRLSQGSSGRRLLPRKERNKGGARLPWEICLGRGMSKRFEHDLVGEGGVEGGGEARLRQG